MKLCFIYSQSTALKILTSLKLACDLRMDFYSNNGQRLIFLSSTHNKGASHRKGVLCSIKRSSLRRTRRKSSVLKALCLKEPRAWLITFFFFTVMTFFTERLTKYIYKVFKRADLGGVRVPYKGRRIRISVVRVLSYPLRQRGWGWSV